MSIELGPRAFACYDVGDQRDPSLLVGGPVPAGAGSSLSRAPGWYVEPGEYRVVVGRSSAELTGTATITISGDPVLLPI